MRGCIDDYEGLEAQFKQEASKHLKERMESGCRGKGNYSSFPDHL